MKGRNAPLNSTRSPQGFIFFRFFQKKPRKLSNKSTLSVFFHTKGPKKKVRWIDYNAEQINREQFPAPTHIKTTNLADFFFKFGNLFNFQLHFYLNHKRLKKIMKISSIGLFVFLLCLVLTHCYGSKKKIPKEYRSKPLYRRRCGESPIRSLSRLVHPKEQNLSLSTVLDKMDINFPGFSQRFCQNYFRWKGCMLTFARF